jgi:hypothetical protein
MADTTAPSLSELMAELARDTETLIRKELELAQVEMSHKVAIASRQATIVATGSGIAYAGLLAVVGGLVLGVVRLGLEPWLAALGVGLPLLAFGGLMSLRGMSVLRRVDVLPRRTLRTLDRMTRWDHSTASGTNPRAVS